MFEEGLEKFISGLERFEPQLDIMLDVLMDLISMSIQASLVIGIVLIIRFLFQRCKIAKKYMMLLWIVPFLCLILPWRISSPVGVWQEPITEMNYRDVAHFITGISEEDSLVVNLPNDDTDEDVVGNHSVTNNDVSDDKLSAGEGDITDNNVLENNGLNQNTSEDKLLEEQGGIKEERPFLDKVEDEEKEETSGVHVIWEETDNSEVMMRQMQFLGLLVGLCLIWSVVVVILYAYSFGNLFLLSRKLRKRIVIRDNIYMVDDIPVPMVVGVFAPKIYIPSGINEAHLEYVIAHEETHIRRKDTLTKVLAYFITCIHWFNPLAWIAYNLMVKDMEMACDEETIARIGGEKKAEYATALLQLSTGMRNVFAVPLAFGEGSTKDRIKNVLSYEKTKTILAVAAIVVGLVVAILFLTTNGKTNVSGVGEESETTEMTEEVEGTATDEPSNQPETESELSYEKIFSLPENEIPVVLLEQYIIPKKYLLFEEYTVEDYKVIESGSASASPATRGEIVYYKAKDSEDLQTIVKTMLGYMLDPLKQSSEERAYTIIEYRLEEQTLRQVGECAWILDYINGYYTYEGKDLVSMEEAMKYEELKDGMLPFMRQGSEIVFSYILLEENGVYRLERFSDMLNVDWSIWNGDHDTTENVIIDSKEEVQKTPRETAIEWIKESYSNAEKIPMDNGLAMQRIISKDVDPSSPSFRNDRIIYRAQTGESRNEIVEKMLDAMLVPLMEPETGRAYTITNYELEEQEFISVGNNAWLIPSIKGYYAYEGIDLVSMEEAMKYETVKDGMVPFMHQGDEEQFFYVLVKAGNVYCLQRYQTWVEYQKQGFWDLNVHYLFDVGVPDEELSPLQKVILNQTPFYGQVDFTDDNPATWHLVEDCAWLCDYTGLNYNSFYVIDMDQDGKDEVCLSYRGYILILREQEDGIYGYNWAFRQFNPPHTNGTFHGSGGAPYTTFYGNVSFAGNVFSHDVITSVTYKKSEPHYYKDGESYSNGVEISKEEYDEIMSVYASEEAKEYSLTYENILKYVP